MEQLSLGEALCKLLEHVKDDQWVMVVYDGGESSLEDMELYKCFDETVTYDADNHIINSVSPAIPVDPYEIHIWDKPRNKWGEIAGEQNKLVAEYEFQEGCFIFDIDISIVNKVDIRWAILNKLLEIYPDSYDRVQSYDTMYFMFDPNLDIHSVHEHIFIVAEQLGVSRDLIKVDSCLTY